MKRRMLLLVILLFCLSGCSFRLTVGDTPVAGESVDAGTSSAGLSETSAGPSEPEKPKVTRYNLEDDPERSDTILFVDGEATGYNNYADGEPIQSLHDCLAKVLVTFRFEDGDWALVYVKNMAESCNSYCWVHADVLKPYDPAAMEERLTYPVRVNPGTVLIDRVRGTEWTAGEWDYWLERQDRTCYIQMEGGISCPVDEDDVIFPRVEDGTILWD